MSHWIWIALTLYVIIGVGIFVAHVLYLQMVTPGLAAMRALAWPVWMTTGWPRGEPTGMD